ncbi:leucine-rich repeat protein [Eubacterium sp.]
MNITVNAKTIQALVNDSKSNQDLIDFLNNVIDEELVGTNPDCDLIDECVELIDELQEHKYTSSAIHMFVSVNSIKKIVNPRRNSWKQLNRAVRVAIIAAMIATGTFTVNAAVKSATGIDIIGNITSAISSFIYNDNKKGELTTEVYVPINETTSAEPTTVVDLEEESTTQLNNITTTATALNVINNEPTTYKNTPKETTTNKKEINKTEIKDEPTDPYVKSDTPQLLGIRAEFEHFKTAYVYGEALSYDGLKIYAKYSDNTEKFVPIDDCAYSKNLDMNMTADYVLSVTYKACTVNVNITVRPDEETRLSELCSNSDWEYLTGDRGVYLTAYKGKSSDVAINEIDGKPIYAITSKVFKDSKIASFSSDTVRVIQQSAFENAEKLKTCNAPNVVSIGNNAFKDSSLQKISFSTELSALGAGAFENTNITNITVPENITIVPERLCNNCSSLKNVTFVGKVETVENMAFNKCSLLTRVRGAGYIKNVGFSAFADDERMKFDSAPKLEKVADGAFANCTKANFGDMGVNLKSLGVRSFENCKGITKVTIPATVETVPEYCFNGVPIQELVIENGVKQIKAGAFKGFVAQELAIPESVEYIGEYSLYSVDLRIITVNSENADIKENAFYLGSRVTFNVIENSTAYDYAVKNNVKYNVL